MGSLEVGAYLFSELVKLGAPALLTVNPETVENLRQSWLTVKTRKIAATAQPSEA
jgi:hypothetical protein